MRYPTWLTYSAFLTIWVHNCAGFSSKKRNFRKPKTNNSEDSKPSDGTNNKIPWLSSSSLLPSCIGHLTIETTHDKVIVETSNNKSLVKIQYHVIGTSHFRCNSYKEVSALIEQEQPDGVVIELDPERLLRLTLDDAMKRKTSSLEKSDSALGRIGKRWFGADFLAAIETSKTNDIPLFLGDEYPEQTRIRFLKTIFDFDAYNPRHVLALTNSVWQNRVGRTSKANMVLVDVVGAFLEDSQKLLPLIVTLSLPLFATILAIAFRSEVTAPTFGSNGTMEGLATAFSLLLSFFASAKVYNNLIVDRDLVLCQNIERATRTILLLKSDRLIRKRWTFGVDQTIHKIVEDKNTFPEDSVPLFTLKNPLEANAIRNLNLFEPRWLKMIDRLLLSKETKDTQGRRIGCVTCTNKFYSAINLSTNPESFVEGRYADVIFHKRGRFGQLIDIQEGSRPSGARKVGVKILGKQSFDLPLKDDGDGILVASEGYLTASNLVDPERGESSSIEQTNDSEEIKIIVVVGLLHANGILNFLSKSHGRGELMG